LPKAIPPIATHVTVAWSVCLSVCLYACMSSVTLVHSPKAVGQNEMPFGRDIRVVPTSIVLDWRLGSPTGRGDLGRNPSSKRCRLSPNYFGLVHFFIHSFVRLSQLGPYQAGRGNTFI